MQKIYLLVIIIYETEVAMGRFKDVFIDMLNKYPEVSLDKYVQGDGSHVYLIVAIDRVHLWGWIDFIKEVNGSLLDYKTEVNLIIYEIIRTGKPISREILKEYGLMVLEER